MNEYPELASFNINDIVSWIQQVKAIRNDDIEDNDLLGELYVRGRKTNRIPSAPNDVLSTDNIGDICTDDNYFYILINYTTPIWKRIAYDTSWVAVEQLLLINGTDFYEINGSGDKLIIVSP